MGKFDFLDPYYKRIALMGTRGLHTQGVGHEENEINNEEFTKTLIKFENEYQKKLAQGKKRWQGDLILPRTVLDSLVSDWSILCECLH